MFDSNLMRRLTLVALAVALPGLVVIQAPVASAANVSLSGVVSYADGSPAAGLSLQIGSNDTGVTLTSSTDSSGAYSVTVPEGTLYNVTFRRSGSGFAANVPSSFEGWVAELEVSGNTTVDITLPAATPTRFKVVDAAGAPLAGARVFLSGGSYGSTSPLGVTKSPSSSYLQGLLMTGQGTEVITDDTGEAVMWFWDFPIPVTAYVQYQASQGFTVNSTIDFTPGTTAIATVTLTIPDLVSLSGVVSYADGSPAAGLSLQIGSNDTGVTLTSSTDSSGAYSVTVPEGTLYNVTFRRSGSGFAANVPSSFEGWVAELEVSGNTTVDITLPAATPTRFKVVDAAGAPLAGARVFLSGGSYGSTSPLGVTKSPSSSYLQGLLMTGQGTEVITDDTGEAVMWFWDFPIPVTAYVQYQASQGFTVNSTIDFTPGTTAVSDVVFSSFAEVESQGSVEGEVTVSLSSDDTFSDISLEPAATSLPTGVVDLVGKLSFTVSGVTVGGSAVVSVRIPPGPPPARVYKVVGRQASDHPAGAAFSGRLITLTIRDGGPGDEDGVANGVIVDPLIIGGLQASSGAPEVPAPDPGGGGGGGGGGGVAPAPSPSNSQSPSPSASPSPSPSPSASPSPAPPVPVVSAPLPGQGEALVGGVRDPNFSLRSDEREGEVRIQGTGFTVELGAGGTGGGVDARGVLVVPPGGSVNVGGGGFAAGDPVSAYIDPPVGVSTSAWALLVARATGSTIRLGDIVADDSGVVIGAYELPSSVPPGDRVLQLVGSTSTGADLALTLGIVVGDRAEKPTITITGSRGKGKERAKVIVRGQSTGLAGIAVRAWAKSGAQRVFVQQPSRVTVTASGRFGWSMKSVARTSVYFTAPGGVRSNTVTVAPAPRVR